MHAAAIGTHGFRGQPCEGTCWWKVAGEALQERHYMTCLNADVTNISGWLCITMVIEAPCLASASCRAGLSTWEPEGAGSRIA